MTAPVNIAYWLNREAHSLKVAPRFTKTNPDVRRASWRVARQF